MATASTELEAKSLPENAYQPLKEGEVYVPLVPSTVQHARSHGARGALGHAAVHRVQRSVGVFGAEGGPGNGGGDSYFHPGDRTGTHLQTPLHGAGERHHHRHWRGFGQRGCRSRLHPAGALHPASRSASAADRLHLPGRRLSRHSLPHPTAPLFCAGAARQAALPGGHGDHRGAGHRREGRIAGQAACCRRPASPRSTTSSSPRFMSGRSI